MQVKDLIVSGNARILGKLYVGSSLQSGEGGGAGTQGPQGPQGP